MPWQDIEAQIAHLFERKAKAGKAMPDPYLFGERLVRKTTAKRKSGSRASSAASRKTPIWSVRSVF